jgi:cytoskeleton protein RodZ
MTGTIGELLKAGRDARNLSLGEVSKALHIREIYLKALEDNAFDVLPSLTQARGFLKLYATFLGLNSQELIASLSPAPVAVQSEKTIPIKPEIKPSTAKRILEKVLKVKKVKVLEPVKDEKLSEYQIILMNIGHDLQARREKLSLTLEEIETHTHIRKDYLNAIESGRINDLPSTIQGRGLLSNYAEFLNLDPDRMLMQFADALQLQRTNYALNKEVPTTEPAKERKKKFSWLRQFLTPDLMIGGSLILILFVFIFWGATQLIRQRVSETTEKAPPISEILLATGSPMIDSSLTPSLLTTDGGSSSVLESPSTPDSVTIPSMAATFNSDAPLQMNITANQRAFLRVLADGREIYNGLVIAGNSYPITAANRIEIITGNAAAFSIIFNQTNTGVLGKMGQVVHLVYTSQGVQTPTPIFTPTGTPTKPVTPTPTPTVTQSTPTVTPFIPNP